MYLITQLNTDEIKKYIIKPQKDFATHKGKISREQIQKLGEGSVFELGKDKFLITKPTLEEYILYWLKRKTQIIYPQDGWQLVLLSWLKGNEKVLESGIGSWALSLLILQMLKTGHLTSVEKREEFAKLAQDNIAQRQQFDHSSSKNHTIITQDICEFAKSTNEKFDIIFLDLKQVDQALECVKPLLKPSSAIIARLPTANQVIATLQKAEEINLYPDLLLTQENTYRIRLAPRLRPQDFKPASRAWMMRLKNML